jgi:L-malate glycosyltransferase
VDARVLIVQESLPQYRVPFFNGLRNSLGRHGVHLDVAHGEPAADVGTRNDGGSIDWSLSLRNRRVPPGSRSAVWQPAYRLSADYDLVIVEHASRLLVNYALLARQHGGGSAVALWGHGVAGGPGSRLVGQIGGAVRTHVSRLPRWWFAYTRAGADHVQSLGFPADRITVVQNAADTSWSNAIALPKQPERCIFLSSLYAEKRLEFLIEACDEIARRRPAFELVVVGDGPERQQMIRWAATRPYLRYRGALFGQSKASELATATLVLNPGRVGLGILDSFAAEAPMVTTEGDFHSPEVEYLSHGRNGWMTENEVEAYVRAVDNLLDDAVLLDRLRVGCRQSAARYSLDEMVDRFTTGVLEACGTMRSTARRVS